MTHQEMYRLVIEAAIEAARRESMDVARHEWWNGLVVGWFIGALGVIIGIVIYAVWPR